MLNRRLFLSCAALLAVGSRAVPSAFAQSISDKGAADFINTLGNEAINTFARKDLPRPQALARFRDLLYQGFDVPYISRWVLGKYWNQASPEQQKEYEKLFERLIVQTYANRFIEYSGETFRIAGTKPLGETDTAVTTQIVRPSGPPVGVDWRVRKKDGGFKIIDVVVEGVSMGVTQRQEFASVIESNGGNINGLLKALRERVS